MRRWRREQAEVLVLGVSCKLCTQNTEELIGPQLTYALIIACVVFCFPPEAS